MPGRAEPWWIAAGVAAAAVFALVSTPSMPPPVGRGSSAPAFELPRLNGAGPLALSQLRGKVVLLNFWATWCKPCEDEMPAMERLYRGLGADRFELVAVSVDSQPELVEAFRSRLGLSFPIVMDSDQTVASAYQTFRFPESFLIGRDGVVVERYIGPREWASPAYVNRIRRLLEGPPG